jgi:hypothetical protein
MEYGQQLGNTFMLGFNALLNHGGSLNYFFITYLQIAYLRVINR